MKNLLFSVCILWASVSRLVYGQCTYYTLQNGETMSSISNGDGNLFMGLLNANPSINFNTATTGTQICIPTATYGSYKLTAASSCTYYTVKSGDTFSTLSNSNTALISALQSANPTVNGYALTVGSTICIPNSLYSSYNFNSATTSCTYYTIKNGDTYYSLSNGNNALISALTAANPTVSAGGLNVGQTICIPNAYYSSYAINNAVTNACASYYTIKSGDTYYSISNGNQALITALTAANPNVNPSALSVGQSICLPSSSAGSYNTYNAYSYGTTTSCSYYTIRSGQTYYSISNGNQALITALTAANPNVNPSALAVGQTICIPTGSYSSYYLY
jgi:LysM repeat protein